MSIIRSQRNALEHVESALVTLQTSLANITTTLLAQRDSYPDLLTTAQITYISEQITYISEADTLMKYTRIAVRSAIMSFPDDMPVQALKRRVNEQLDKI